MQTATQKPSVSVANADACVLEGNLYTDDAGDQCGTPLTKENHNGLATGPTDDRACSQAASFQAASDCTMHAVAGCSIVVLS